MNHLATDLPDGFSTAPPPPPPQRSLSSLSPSAPPFSIDRPLLHPCTYSPSSDFSYDVPWPSPPPSSSSSEFFVGSRTMAAEALAAGLLDDFDSDFDRNRGVSLPWIDPAGSGQFSHFDHGISAETFMVSEDSTSTHWGKDPTSSTTWGRGLESSALFNENNSWACTRNSMLPLYNKHDKSFLNQSELRQSHFDIQDKSSTAGTCNTDTLTGQLTSHSTDSLIYNPSAVLSAQQQLNAMSYGAVSSPRCCRISSGHSSIQHINPYKIHNYFDYTPTEKTNSIPNEKEQDCLGIKNNTTVDEASFYSSTAIAGSSIHSDNFNWNAMEQSSDLKFGSRILGMCPPSSSVSSYYPNVLDNSFPVHSITLDQQNAVVDSPCWKGTVPSNQFDICNDANHVSILNDLRAGNHGDQKQKGTAVSIESLKSSILNEKQNSPFKETSTVGPELLAKPKKAEIESSVETEVSASQNCDSLQKAHMEAMRIACEVFGLKNHDIGHLNKEKNASQVEKTATNDVYNLNLNSVFDPSCARDNVMGTPTHEVDVLPNYSKSSVPSSFSSECPDGNIQPSSFSSECPDGNIQLLCKAIYGLTEVLVSNKRDVNKLKEHDMKLLHEVIGNLKEYVHSEKKGSFSKIEHQEEGITKKSGHVSGIEASFSLGESKLSTSMNENVHGIDLKLSNNVNPDDFASRDISANYRRRMNQAVEDVSKENYFEPKDDPQALLYKNLWIEAEVSLCRLKYELQFARLKLDMKRTKHSEVIMEGDHDQKFSRRGRLNETREAERNKLKVGEFHEGLAGDVASSSAASDMDKFKILRQFVNSHSDALEVHPNHHEFLDDKSCSETGENQKVNLDEPSDTHQKKIPQLSGLHDGHEPVNSLDKSIFTVNNCKLNKIEVNEQNSDNEDRSVAAVMARLKVLRARTDDLSSETIEGHKKFQDLDSVSQQPCTSDKSASKLSVDEFTPSIQYPGTEHLGEIVRPPNFLGCVNKGEGLAFEAVKTTLPFDTLDGGLGSTSDGPCGNISSEWEHIM